MATALLIGTTTMTTLSSICKILLDEDQLAALVARGVAPPRPRINVNRLPIHGSYSKRRSPHQNELSSSYFPQ